MHKRTQLVSWSTRGGCSKSKNHSFRTYVETFNVKLSLGFILWAGENLDSLDRELVTRTSKYERQPDSTALNSRHSLTRLLVSRC